MEAEFDHIAKEYDATFTDTAVGKAQRNVVHSLLEEFTYGKDLYILELNCGTGEDALHLAQKGTSVLATDISPEMVSEAQQKTASFPNVQTKVLDILEVNELGQSFDIIFSNFGGLNCLNAEQIKKFLSNVNDSLKVGGKLILVIMPTFCLWETFYFSAKLKFGSAFRRRKKNGVLAQVEDKLIRTYYFSPRFIRRNATNFKTTKVAPVGFFIPPSYLDNWFRNKPKTIQKLIRWDKRVLKFNKLASLSDHYFICLEKV